MSGTNNGNGGVFWKLVLTAMVVAWAISSMVPFSDTPFEDYIKTRATAFQQEFAGVIKSAEARVDKVNYKGFRTSPRLFILPCAIMPMQMKLICQNIFQI